MSWRDFFKSSYVRSLENQIDYLRAQLADQKTAHAQEKERDITQIQRLQDDLQKALRLYNPGLADISLPHEQEEEKDATTEGKETITFATPWERAKHATHELDRKRTLEREAARAKGVTDGGLRPTGTEAPLSESSKPG